MRLFRAVRRRHSYGDSDTGLQPVLTTVTTLAWVLPVIILAIVVLSIVSSIPNVLIQQSFPTPMDYINDLYNKLASLNNSLTTLNTNLNTLGFSLNTLNLSYIDFKSYADPLLNWVKTVNITGTATYIVFTDGVRYYAKNGTTGIIEYVNTEAANVIQYAIDKVNALGGGKVLVRRGRYPITKTITVKDNVVLEGEGWNATILYGYPANAGFGPVLFITGKNIVVRGLAVDGNYTTTPSGYSRMRYQNIVVGNAQYVLIERILSTRSACFTIAVGQNIDNLNKDVNSPPFAPVYDAIIRDSIFFPGADTFGVGKDGIHVFGGQRIAIVNNIVYDTGDDVIGVGADSNYPASDILIAGNLLHSNRSRGITLHTGTVGETPAPSIIKNVFIVNNIFTGNTPNILMTACDSGNCTDFVDGLYVVGNSGGKIYLNGVKNAYIVGNIIRDKIRLCDSHYNYPTSPYGYANTHDIYIYDNIIYDNVEFYFRAGGSIYNIFFVGNRMYGRITDYYIYVSTFTLRDIHIYDNHFEYCGDILYIMYGQNYYVKRNKFVGCTTRGTHILIQYSPSNIHIEGNTFDLVQYAHILLHNNLAGSGVFIYNNYFSPNAAKNIEVRAGSNIYIQNNIVGKRVDLSVSGYGSPSNVFFERNIVLPGASVTDALNVAVKKYNRGYTTENSGVTTISAGSTRVTVSHGLATTPTKVLITPLGQPPGKLWVENITSTSFDIVTDTAPTSNLNVAWYAEV